MPKSQGVDSVDSQRSALNAGDSEDRSVRNTIQSILVVDPDPDFSSTVSDYLKLFGYNICYRTELDEALSYAADHDSDVVFLADNFEYNHPIDVLRKFKQVLPNSLVAILASRGDDQLAVELLKAGADDYLSRRIKDKDILTAIAALLDKFTAQPVSHIKFKENEVVLPSSTILPDSRQFWENEIPTDSRSRTGARRSEYELDPASISLVNQSKLNNENKLLEFDQLPGQLIFLDGQYNLVDINPACLELLEVEKKNIINQPAKNIIPIKFYVELVARLEPLSSQQSSLSGGQFALDFELVLNGTGGKDIPAKCRVSRFNLRLSNGLACDGYLISVEDLSKEKSAQADILYQNMWSNLLQSFGHRFINLRLDEFASEISQVVEETASFFRLDRISIYLFDKKLNKAKIYLEWLRAGGESLKLFSKKIEIDSSMPEFKILLADKIQLLQPSRQIKESTIDQSWGLSEHYSQVNALSSMVMPIVIKSKIIGWMSMDYQSDRVEWEAKDEKMLAPLNRLISEAFELREKEEQRKVTHQKLSENYGQLSEQAFLDGLTNLANRRYFDKVLESEVRRASREKTNIALLFCDVDYFKAYNDSYGHMEGDLCLKAIADVMRNEFQRAGDFVARFGGEEFAVILSGTLADDAFDSAEKLRKSVFGMQIGHKASPIGKVAISIGISSIIGPEPNDSKKLLSKADKALYKAKNRGRNRVEFSAFSPR